jgi:hypothetical protein
MGPFPEATASRTTVVEGRLVRLSQRDYRTALSTYHSSIGLEGVSGQRRRSKWRVRPGQCLALRNLLSHELPRGQAAGLYQRSSGLRSMAHPKWLIVLNFNLHRLHLKIGTSAIGTLNRRGRKGAQRKPSFDRSLRTFAFSAVVLSVLMLRGLI